MSDWEPGSRLGIYNEVVNYYNLMSPGTLEPVPTIHTPLESPKCSWFCYFILTLVPGLNLFLIFLFTLQLLSVLKEICIVLRNRKRVPNPFSIMLADPSLSRPCIKRLRPRDRSDSHQYTSDSVVAAGSGNESNEVICYRPDCKETYERMGISAICSCVFAGCLVFTCALFISLDVCWGLHAILHYECIDADAN